MNNYNNSDESLKRSHSVKSNANLSLLSIISSIVLSIFVISIALIEKLDYALYVAIGSGVLFALLVLGFTRFKR